MSKLLRTALALLSIPFAASAADLTIGAEAPPFSLPGSDGKTHALTDHAGKRAVVLAWFPKAFTPG
jgi:peroxiredoxin Q/BCP